MPDYTITCEVVGCTAAAANPTTIAEDGTASLSFTSTDAKESWDLTCTGATAAKSVAQNKKSCTVELSEPTADVSIELTAYNTFDITTKLNQVTADNSNPTTITSSGTADLVFTAKSGFPFNDYAIKVTGASFTKVVAANKKSVTVKLSNATDDVTVEVAAIINQSVNVKYVVIDDVLYIDFNNRKLARWNKRWLRNNL